MIKISLKDEERIKRALSNFFIEEYDCVCDELTSVISMAFTEINQTEIQVNLHPFELKLLRYVDGALNDEHNYSSVEDMIEEVEMYDFDMLISG